MTELQVKEIVLPRHFHILTSDIKEITETALLQEKYTQIRIVQNHLQTDFSRNWHDALNDNVLLDELAGKIIAARKLLVQIAAAKIPWIYVFENDCLGSGFELALVCHFRICLKPSSYFGFPEIHEGLFPPLGGFERMIGDNHRRLDKWRKIPMRTTDWHGIHYYGTDNDKPFLTKIGERFVTNFVASDQEKNPNSLQHSDQDLFQKIDDLKGFGKEKINAWEFCSVLVKEKFKRYHPKIDDILAKAMAREYLKPGYLAWLRRKISQQTNMIESKELDRTMSLHIDLSGLLPKTETLFRFCDSGYRLIFVHDESDQLISKLELIFSRMERADRKDAQEIWASNVFWFAKPPKHRWDRHKKTTMLRWLSDDGVEICYEGDYFEFRRIECDARVTHGGLVEFYSPEKLPEPVHQILDCVFEYQFASIQNWEGIPYSEFFRSIVFRELMRIAPHRDSDLFSVLECLLESGWTFAGREELWDSFLRTRSETQSLDKEFQKFCPEDFERSVWEIGNVKTARSLVKKEGKKLARWNAQQVSRHVAIFLGLLVEYLSTANRAEIESLDFVASEALGFPSHLGTSLNHLKVLGSGRVATYRKNSWPGL